MSTAEYEESTILNVVVNHEEQYSIWPADCEPPGGGRKWGRAVLNRNVSPI